VSYQTYAWIQISNFSHIFELVQGEDQGKKPKVEQI